MPSTLRPHDHLVQFYGSNDRLLVDNVARYLAKSLECGGGAIAIAGPEHAAAIRSALTGFGLTEATLDGRFIALDAAATLAQFMAGGRPSPVLFDAVVGERARRLVAEHGRFRAYGEMVGLLWRDERHAAANALEEFWNGLLSSSEFDLFCGYPIDVLGVEFQVGCVDGVLSAHTSVVSSTPENFEKAIELAMDDVLGSKVGGLRLVAMTRPHSSWPDLPICERTILWLRNQLPRYADEIVGKARAYCAS
jgi:hypothetical protein